MPEMEEILLIEDNSARAIRRVRAGQANVTVRIHRLTLGSRKVVAKTSYRPGSLDNGGRALVALKLLDRLGRIAKAVVVAGPVYGANRLFLEGLLTRKLDFTVEVRPSSRFQPVESEQRTRLARASSLARVAKWGAVNLQVDGADAPRKYSVARVVDVRLPCDRVGHLFAAQTGGIPGLHRGTIFALTSRGELKVRDLLRCVGWVRWIRPATRKHERIENASIGRVRPATQNGHVRTGTITVRANITLARLQDEKRSSTVSSPIPQSASLRRVLAPRRTVLNVVELFSGAGGMGLGFLMSAHSRRRFRLLFSGEIKQSFVETLTTNHAAFGTRYARPLDHVPSRTRAVDLGTDEARRMVRQSVARAGEVHVLIGGPPCQGFSNANRNSWSSGNPNNRLVDVFLDYVEDLRPPVFVMENVQGILWTSKAGRSEGRLGVMDHLEQRMREAGYLVFPKLLDSVWFGVPQHRSRIFLMGIRGDLGYSASDFGDWGPFPQPTHGPGRPRPYVTVRDAIGDLPRVGNGSDAIVRWYRSPRAAERKRNPFLALMRENAPPRSIFDHVTSRHAPYVIERYRRIPPGGNWEDIAEHLTNYSRVNRTHSNIYRRLEWDRPAITIGHYRKSMIVHPSQHRGLSLREASRLQSFPDWFRFSGPLVDQQQQLANAVSPLIAKAIGEFILRL